MPPCFCGDLIIYKIVNKNNVNVRNVTFSTEKEKEETVQRAIEDLGQIANVAPKSNPLEEKNYYVVTSQTLVVSCGQFSGSMKPLGKNHVYDIFSLNFTCS